jgi:hypothetical protein
MSFLRLWITGIINTSMMYGSLRERPAPLWGFFAVLMRFIGTSVTTVLFLYLKGQYPFRHPSLAFIPENSYYAAEIFFMPLFGILIWLLMGAVSYLLVRLSRREGSFDSVLNVVGFGMLIPMPVVWVWDWTVIEAGRYSLLPMAVSHLLFQLWEAGVEYVGFRKLFGFKRANALGFLFSSTPCTSCWQ